MKHRGVAEGPAGAGELRDADHDARLEVAGLAAEAQGAKAGLRNLWRAPACCAAVLLVLPACDP